MAYTKTTWADGDVITAEKLNKIEDELATLDEKGDSVVSFELSDRIAKGVDINGNVVDGAVIEGQIKDRENQGNVTPKNIASGRYSHAEGGSTKASESCSHAEGASTTASGPVSHAEGTGTTASGSASHAEGSGTTASGVCSHAEVFSTTASGDYSHAEGFSTTASGDYSHAEGFNTKASGTYQHVQGKYNIEDTNNTYAHIVGGGTSESDRKNIHTLDWSGNAIYAGKVTVGAAPTADMDLATKKYVDEHSGGGSDWDLSDRLAKGVDSNGTIVNGAVVEGAINANTASGSASHAEGGGTTASGVCSHAEVFSTTASGDYSHAEGFSTTASGSTSHAEGANTKASGNYSHAEGVRTTASGNYSHAEGVRTTASGDYSHAEGFNTKASGTYQHVQGKYNIEDTNNTYAHIVGGGTSESDRKNIHTLDWSGNAYFASSLTLGSTTINEIQLLGLLNMLNDNNK